MKLKKRPGGLTRGEKISRHNINISDTSTTDIINKRPEGIPSPDRVSMHLDGHKLIYTRMQTFNTRASITTKHHEHHIPSHHFHPPSPSHTICTKFCNAKQRNAKFCKLVYRQRRREVTNLNTRTQGTWLPLRNSGLPEASGKHVDRCRYGTE